MFTDTFFTCFIDRLTYTCVIYSEFYEREKMNLEAFEIRMNKYGQDKYGQE